MQPSKEQMHSFITLAVMLELSARTIKKLEEKGRLTTVDPEHNIKLNDVIVTKQIADAIVTQLNG
jgi:hypothetical protein